MLLHSLEACVFCLFCFCFLLPKVVSYVLSESKYDYDSRVHVSNDTFSNYHSNQHAVIVINFALNAFGHSLLESKYQDI